MPAAVALDSWRMAGAGFFKQTKTAPAIPVTEAIPDWAEAMKAFAAGTEGLLRDPRPEVRFMPGFRDSSPDFTLVVHVRNYVDQFPVQHDMRKRIVRRFAQEGIEFAFPTRTLVLDKTALPLLGGAAVKSEPEA